MKAWIVELIDDDFEWVYAETEEEAEREAEREFGDKVLYVHEPDID